MIFHFREKEIYRFHQIWLITDAVKSCQAINVICNLTTVSELPTGICNRHLPQMSVHIITMSLNKSTSRLELDSELDWKSGELSSHPVCQ